MSRIGKKPILIPAGVEAKVTGSSISVKGPKGSVSRNLPEWLVIESDGKILNCNLASEMPEMKAQWGLYRVLISNMIQGVSAGYRKELDIVGVGYKAEMKGKDVILNVGLSHAVTICPLEGVKIATQEANKAFKVIVEGIDREAVGQVAANIRRVRPPEPYQGKGIKYSDETVIRKVGKAAGK